ncbi:hypothetical protein V8F20_000785 [Naviculisporaceae sp. PSN 640]
MAAQGSTIDPTKAAKYPIILSDALLGKASKETYTGVRYNHKPTLSSETAPNSARLKQSAKEGVFNLGFDDQGKVYQYSGTRTSEDGKYVLIFDPARKAFILHRVDSLFHMNLTKTPTDGNVESLRKQFPHLEVTPSAASSTGTKQTKAKAEKASAAGGKAAATKATSARGKGAKAETAASKAKAEKAKVDKNKAAVALTLPSANAAPIKSATPPPAPAPAPAPEKKKSRARSPIDSEEDDSDDDIGLTIEYPDGPPRNHFSPAFPTQRRFSEFVRSNEDGDADAEGDPEDDAEAEEEFEDAFKLPSPVNRGHPSRPPVVEEPIPIEEPLQFTFHSDTDSDADGEADVEMGEPDAEADADAAFDEDALLLEFQDGNESDVSEEE